MQIRDEEISVILVDENDEIVGYGDKLDVHRKGLLHRAFSVFIYNDQDQLLLQQRALGKYHAGGLWANSCCGHPLPGEPAEKGADRRLFEELGFHCPLKPLTHIYYKKDLDHGMIEHEYVHVFCGRYQGQTISCDPAEVSTVAWMTLEEIAQDVASYPEKYAAWFSHYVEDYLDVLKSYRTQH
jgi:isopentenyl-diphosphate delta-isomerase